MSFNFLNRCDLSQNLRLVLLFRHQRRLPKRELTVIERERNFGADQIVLKKKNVKILEDLIYALALGLLGKTYICA